MGTRTEEVSLKDVKAAAERIAPYIHNTPMDYSKTFSELTGASVYLKLENLQKTGSFKVRGALNKLLGAPRETVKKGVITASAGNHAQGVAYSAASLGIPSTVVMPKWASEAKVKATKNYGAEVILYGTYFDDSAAKAKEIAQERGIPYVPAFDDDQVIAGQGTVGLEMLTDEPDLEALVIPVGGGGLISGVAIAAKSIKPDIKVIGVESEAFPAVHDLIRDKQPNFGYTIADGIAVKNPSERTLHYIKEYVDDVVLVSDDDLARAVFLLLERAKTVVEPAGAAGLAALLSGKIDLRGKKVGVLLSGGNVDVHLLSRIIDRALMDFNRMMIISFVAPDRPGALASALSVIADEGANVIHVQHEREGREVPLGFSKVRIWMEIPETSSKEELLKKLASVYPSAKEDARSGARTNATHAPLTIEMSARQTKKDRR